MSVKTYQLSFHMCICAFDPEVSSFFGKSFNKVGNVLTLKQENCIVSYSEIWCELYTLTEGGVCKTLKDKVILLTSDR